MRLVTLWGATLTTLCSLLVAGAAGAGDLVVENDNPKAAAVPAGDATRAITNPQRAPDTSRVKALTADGTYAPGVKSPTGDAAAPTARAFGSFGIPYTATRVSLGKSTAPRTSPNYLATTFPYRAIGRLNFTYGYCSASLIRRSVIVTAAHCIQYFGARTYTYGGWQFIPAYYGPGSTAAERAPYGVWPWQAFARPNSWANGTDPGEGAARANDLAVIILAKDAKGRFVGDVTGYLGYAWNNYSFVASPKTGNLAVAAVSTLGYPSELDDGMILQRTDGPTYTTRIGGAPQLWQGSNYTSGSSGGPWIVNFLSANPARSFGAVPGRQSRLAVIGVTSWGSDDPNLIKDNYSSQFGQNSIYPKASYGSYGAGNIGSLLNSVCSRVVTGGQKTYAQLGYCD